MDGHERDKQIFEEEQLKIRNIDSLQEICRKIEVESYGGTPNEMVANVRKRVVDAVCVPLLQNPNVEVMSLPASLTIHKDALHTIVAKSKVLSFQTVWIGDGPFTVLDSQTFESKPATLEEVLVMTIVQILKDHFDQVLKNVDKLVLYVPLQLSFGNNMIARTRYATFTAPLNLD